MYTFSDVRGHSTNVGSRGGRRTGHSLGGTRFRRLAIELLNKHSNGMHSPTTRPFGQSKWTRQFAFVSRNTTKLHQAHSLSAEFRVTKLDYFRGHANYVDVLKCDGIDDYILVYRHRSDNYANIHYL